MNSNASFTITTVMPVSEIRTCPILLTSRGDLKPQPCRSGTNGSRSWRPSRAAWLATSSTPGAAAA
ncbi:MAG: hypothetical protein Q6370_003065 [Candidatus Sigynarchaeota archaeon]